MRKAISGFSMEFHMEGQAGHSKGPRLLDVFRGVMVVVGIYAVVRYGSELMAYLNA